MSASLPQQWLDKADEDLVVARLVLAEGFYSHVCFLAQQGVEKALKGYLLARTKTYPRTHGLVDLVKQCAAFDPEINRFSSDCSVIDQYYTPSRYPDALAGIGPGALPDRQEAEEVIESADKILQYVTARLS
jgi:HEPN domain-containing protein